jgi:hypothetical protein
MVERIDPEDMELRERVDQPMYRHRNQKYGPVERVDNLIREEEGLPPFAPLGVQTERAAKQVQPS